MLVVSMKYPSLSLFLIFIVAVAPFFSNLKSSNAQVAEQGSPEVYFGVYLAYATTPTAAAKALIDEVSGYTNLFVSGSMLDSTTGDWLNETLQYAYDRGLYFVSFTPWGTGYPGGNTTLVDWFTYAHETWGNHLLGFLVPSIDEPAGKQLDGTAPRWLHVTSAADYADAARQFESLLGSQLTRIRESKTSILNNTIYPLFTCDYALYQFDYNAGFDVVFAEFGWNYSRQLNAALCRGAATTQNKDWGAIISWTYTVPPYIESGDQLYNDLLTAYDNGAKYITIFDSNKEFTQSILQPEHLSAMQKFWQYIQNNPRKSIPQSERVAFVLPQDYGYGFRGPDDKIWGLWPADDLSRNISTAVGNLLNQYGSKLDIIYQDDVESGKAEEYSKIIYWNDASLIQPAPDTEPPTNSTSDSQNEISTSPTQADQDNTTANNNDPATVPTGVLLTAAMCIAAVPVIVAFVVLRRRSKSSKKTDVNQAT
jgi:hypothetical protein